MRLHVFAGENAILKFQACPKHLPLCQSCNSSNGQLAVGLCVFNYEFEYLMQACGNTMPDLPDQVLDSTGQVLF